MFVCVCSVYMYTTLGTRSQLPRPAVGFLSELSILVSAGVGVSFLQKQSTHNLLRVWGSVGMVHPDCAVQVCMENADLRFGFTIYISLFGGPQLHAWGRQTCAPTDFFVRNFVLNNFYLNNTVMQTLSNAIIRNISNFKYDSSDSHIFV